MGLRVAKGQGGLPDILSETMKTTKEEARKAKPKSTMNATMKANSCMLILFI